MSNCVYRENYLALVIARQMAFTEYKGGVTGQVWSTYSQIGRWKFGVILAADVQHTYNITPQKAGFSDSMVRLMTSFLFLSGSYEVLSAVSVAVKSRFIHVAFVLLAVSEIGFHASTVYAQ